jgi:hypothetical protein
MGMGQQRYGQEQMMRRGGGAPQKPGSGGYGNGSNFGGGGGQGFGGGSGVTYGAPEPAPEPAQSSGWGPPQRPQRETFQPLDFRGLNSGGSVQNGDFRIQNGDDTGMFNAAQQAWANVTNAGIGADAQMYGSDNNTMASMLASMLQLQGIEAQVGGNNYGVDANERIQEGAQGVQTYGIDKNLEGQLANYANQLGMTDMTSGRNLEGRLAEITGRQGIADTQARSAETVADLQNLRYKNQHEQYGQNNELVQQWMANAGSGQGSRGIGGDQYERIDPTRAIAANQGENAAMEQAMINSGGGGGASPQAGAYGQRAALQRAMADTQGETGITTQYANTNNANRLAMLKAQNDARNAQTADRDGLLQFLASSTA